jgi:hypothetical protein
MYRIPFDRWPTVAPSYSKALRWRRTNWDWAAMIRIVMNQKEAAAIL